MIDQAGLDLVTVDPDWGFEAADFEFGFSPADFEFGFEAADFDFGIDLDFGFDVATTGESLLYKQVLEGLAVDVANLAPVERNRFLAELYGDECAARRRRTLSGRRPPRRHRTTLP